MKRRAKDPEHALPRMTPDELLRLLITPSHAFELVTRDLIAEALANATRSFGKLSREGLDHLGPCRNILIALAELDLRAKEMPPAMIQRVGDTAAAVAAAEAALDAAKRAHVRAKAEVLLALGYRKEAEASGFKIGSVEEVATP